MEAIANHLRTLAATNILARLAQLRLRTAGRFEQGLSSSSMRYGLCRDLNVPLERPAAKIPLAVRSLLESDVPSLLSLENAQGDSRDKLEIAWRRAFLEKKGATGCFVAVDLRTDTPCYMQWLMSLPIMISFKASGASRS
jgi:hypothetical protein